jgi:hypothetical protein
MLIANLHRAKELSAYGLHDESEVSSEISSRAYRAPSSSRHVVSFETYEKPGNGCWAHVMNERKPKSKDVSHTWGRAKS